MWELLFLIAFFKTKFIIVLGPVFPFFLAPAEASGDNSLFFQDEANFSFEWKRSSV